MAIKLLLLLVAYILICMQGVIKFYNPQTKSGIILDASKKEYSLSPTALDGSIFRMLRQGQRVIFNLDEQGLATSLNLGSEIDLQTKIY